MQEWEHHTIIISERLSDSDEYSRRHCLVRFRIEKKKERKKEEDMIVWFCVL
jgi:hypothetical protein